MRWRAGEAWNQGLREAVPAAFMDAVRSAAHHPATALSWMRFLPAARGAAQAAALQVGGVCAWPDSSGFQ